MTKTTPLFMRNIEAIRDITKLSQENFCNVDEQWKWDDLEKALADRKLSWDDLSTYKLYGAYIHVLHISPNTYTNYLNGRTSPSEEDLVRMLNDINEIRKRHPVLKKCFSQNISIEQLRHHDLLKEFNDDASHSNSLFVEKFFGTYLCYYNSTTLDDDEKTPQFGILQLSKGQKEGEFETKGIFSFKKEHEAIDIFNDLQNGKSFKEASGGTSHPVFTGLSYLSPTLLWCNMSDGSKTEHVSMSFDLSAKITTKHPEDSFVGARGISLSQTSGQSNQTTTFPIVIISEPIQISYNELTKFLCFNYSRIPEDKLTALAKRSVRLMTSLLQNDDIDNDLRLKLISQIVEHEVNDLLEKHIFNSHYYLPKELNLFYKAVIRPIRRSENKDETDSQDDE